MEEQIVSFETAKLAQEKGCRETTQLAQLLYIYNDTGVLCKEYFYEPDYDSIEYPDIIAPTQSLLQKWLREKYGLYVNIEHYENSSYRHSHTYCISTKNELLKDYDFKSDEILSYEEALEKGLKQALNLINN